MSAPYDIDSKQISDSIAIKDGIVALLATSSDEQRRLLAAYEAMKARAEAAEARADKAEERADAAEQRADKAEAEAEHWKELAMKPRVILKDHASVGNIITGNLNEHYAEDSSIPGQQPLRQLSIG